MTRDQAFDSHLCLSLSMAQKACRYGGARQSNGRATAATQCANAHKQRRQRSCLHGRDTAVELRLLASIMVSRCFNVHADLCYAVICSRCLCLRARGIIEFESATIWRPSLTDMMGEDALHPREACRVMLNYGDRPGTDIGLLVAAATRASTHTLHAEYID